MSKTINVGFIGNPNCGKTTLFNAFTGANLKVANWPGVTVEKKEGYTTYEGEQFKLVDLPGIYSLTSYTMEEKVSRECIMSDEIDVIVDVVDASCLERNLYLTLQLIELGKPVILALNMMDELRANGGSVHINELEAALGIPVVPISAVKNEGIDELVDHAMHVALNREVPKRVDFCPPTRLRAIHLARCTVAFMRSCTCLSQRRARQGCRFDSPRRKWSRATRLSSARLRCLLRKMPR